MRREAQAHARMVAASLDVVLLGAAWTTTAWLRAHLSDWWGWDLFPGEPILQELSFGAHSWLALLLLPCFLLSLQRVGAYADLRGRQPRVDLTRAIKASVLATLLFVGLAFALQLTDDLSRSLVFVFPLTAVPTVLLSRALTRRLVRQGVVPLPPWTVLLVGTGEGTAPLLHTLDRHREWGIDVVGAVAAHPGEAPPEGVPRLGDLHELGAILERRGVDEVMVGGSAWDMSLMRQVGDVCDAQGVRLSMDAGFLGLNMGRSELRDLEGSLVLSFTTAPADTGPIVLKRWLDVVIASLMLVALAPLMGLTALLVRLQDGGPVLFSQQRSGRFGKPFTMWKFRSMEPDAESRTAEVASLNEMDGPVFKARADPRITPLGAILRRFSIDELPQLVNILRGEMSLVGPRPPLPAEVARYERWQLRRLCMAPGLTCIWQVSGRNDVDFDTWMQLDLQYIDNWSLGLDLKLLAKTVPVVLMGVGAR